VYPSNEAIPVTWKLELNSRVFFSNEKSHRVGYQKLYTIGRKNAFLYTGGVKEYN